MRSPFLLALLLPACIVVETGPDGAPGDPVQVPCCMAGEGSVLDTLSVLDEGSSLAVSLTDDDGPLACALSEDDELPLGRSGAQLFLRVDPGWFHGCDDGVHPIGGPDCGPGPGVPTGCGRFRVWDAGGRLVEETWAVSGALIVTEGSSGRCEFEVEAVLPGGEVLAGQAATGETDVWGNDAVCNRR